MTIDLTLRQLEYAAAVADTLGFHRAAERCHVSQPTLSAQVQQLETVLGVKLFERDSRRVIVTPAGEEIVARARRILVEANDLVGVANRSRDPFAATFRIGVIPTVAPYLLPDITPALAKKWPALRLIFREEKTEEVMKELGDGRLDAGLLALDADIGGDVASALVCEDAFVLALPHGHPLAKKKRVPMDDLEGEDVLLLDEGHCFGDQTRSLCTRFGAREGDLRATSLGTLVQMVSSGAGLTLLPQIAVDVENRRGQLDVRPFTAPVPSRKIGLVWRPRSPFGETFEAIAEAMSLSCKSRGRP